MRSWVEINLNAIEDNIKNIRQITNPNAKIMAVIKADGYGHGFYEIAKAVISNGADCFGVATVEEALLIREKGFSEDILVLSPIPEENIEEAVKNNITLTVFSYDYASIVSKTAQKLGVLAKIHIKLDTGMSRIGYVVNDTDNAEIIDEILNISNPMVIGIIIGIIGMVISIINYPVYVKKLSSRRKKYASEIMALSDRIIKK